jgi:uncharacterized protein with GYD domain
VATYIVLGTFEQGGLTKLLDKDVNVATDIAGEIDDVTVAKVWFTTGMYDVVVLLEAETNGAALAFAAAYSFDAGLTAQTLAAEEEDTVAPVARVAHTRHQDRHGP